MPNFQHRSNKLEILDDPNIPFADIRQNMRELDTINTLLGGHGITLNGVKEVLENKKTEGVINILEIGCGDGNNLRVIKKWAHQKGLRVALTGVDYNLACIDYAKSLEENNGIEFICSDYRQVQIFKKPHLIFSSLFCHHFQDEELVAQLQWMRSHAALGFFINDLHRHPLAYYSIGLLTQFFSKSYLVKNDAPLSVLRGFKKREWQHLLQQAGIEGATCSWKWAFRWLVVCKV